MQILIMGISFSMYIINVATHYDNAVEVSVNAYHSLVVVPSLIAGYFSIYREL